jgi:hypothetical protein
VFHKCYENTINILISSNNKQAFQKMNAKKFLSNSKEKNKVAILECCSILKEKNKFSIPNYHETKLFDVYLHQQV